MKFCPLWALLGAREMETLVRPNLDGGGPSKYQTGDRRCRELNSR
ncbi:hypothetical protein [Synechocystis sp. PCC 7339]|nr:hypothetical protein [Synechocystis sp. PCC 7339]